LEQLLVDATLGAISQAQVDSVIGPGSENGDVPPM